MMGHCHYQRRRRMGFGSRRLPWHLQVGGGWWHVLVTDARAVPTRLVTPPGMQMCYRAKTKPRRWAFLLLQPGFPWNLTQTRAGITGFAWLRAKNKPKRIRANARNTTPPPSPPPPKKHLVGKDRGPVVISMRKMRGSRRTAKSDRSKPALSPSTSAMGLGLVQVVPGGWGGL